ncbi:hypothetical protein [Flexivirga oryzae]|uniref:Uncharacterized protein n=1 Tax=Flexivirga oryzae TaxID=1794944 RepID=A0A839NHP5_9MICO|nr:hypothetical protein [Flexivirga oryzae]MBB2893942.1 hypothetical protein [Flexivirga oryzae]
MSFRYKVRGAWDDQLPPDLREPYAGARAKASASGAAPLGVCGATIFGFILLLAAVAIAKTALVGPQPPKTASNLLLGGVVVLAFALVALLVFRYAWIRYSWARQVRVLTGVNALTWDVTKPLPTRGRPDIPLGRQG